MSSASEPPSPTATRPSSPAPSSTASSPPLTVVSRSSEESTPRERQRPRATTPELDQIMLDFEINSLDSDQYYRDMLAAAQGTQRVACAMVIEMVDEKDEHTMELVSLACRESVMEMLVAKFSEPQLAAVYVPKREIAVLVKMWIAEEMRRTARQITNLQDLIHGCILRYAEADKTAETGRAVLAARKIKAAELARMGFTKYVSGTLIP
uniref:Uncharacterized protein n=1 Tax=Mycena chlorophos TaxID=658473 RepID=A0ABQ0KXT8_MYCCL|nr:predicted protein [Mycena chlorophos]